MKAVKTIGSVLMCVCAIGLYMTFHKRPVGAQTTTAGLVPVTLSASTPANTAFKAGITTLSGNVTSWTIANGFDPYQSFGLVICQPSNAVYTVTGAPSNFSGTLLVPTVAGGCMITGMAWFNGIWYVLQVPVASVAGLATVATSGKYADLTATPAIPTKLSQLTNDSGYALASAIPTTLPYSAITGTPAIPSTTGLITSAQAPVQSVNGQTGAVTLSIPATIPVYTSPAMTTTGLVQYQTVTSSMSAAVTTSQAFECGVTGGGANTPKLTAVAYVTTNGTLSFALTNQALATLSATPTMNAVCKPLN